MGRRYHQKNSQNIVIRLAQFLPIFAYAILVVLRGSYCFAESRKEQSMPTSTCDPKLILEQFANKYFPTLDRSDMEIISTDKG